MGHTPGPWTVGLTIGSAHVSPEGPWGWWETDIDGPTGEGCFLSLRQYHGGEVGQANARLIAAAPELLEALRRVAEALEAVWQSEMEWTGEWDMLPPDAIERAKSAMAKAEGR